MAIPYGFSYVKGPVKYVLSALSSVATFKERCPVTIDDDCNVIEAASDSTAIFGISAHAAADSLPAGYCLIEVPTADTIYAGRIGTSASASEASIGRGCDIEKLANHFILNEDSQASTMVVIVPRDDGSTLRSADSSVHFSFLGNRLGVMGSNSSIVVFAEL